MSASYTSTPFNAKSLIAANSDLLFHDAVTLLSGQNLARGAVVGKVTASGKYVLSASAASDGSQTPAGILVDDADATAGDVTALIYTRGDFAGTALILGAGHTVAGVRAAFKDMGVFIVSDIAGA